MILLGYTCKHGYNEDVFVCDNDFSQDKYRREQKTHTYLISD